MERSNEMKKFEEAKIEVLEFDVQDVITESGNLPTNCTEPEEV